jgi:DNA repair photolyase
VDLRSELLALLAPLGIGDAIVPGARLVDASTELGLRFLIACDDGREIEIEVDPIDEGRAHAARSRHFAFGYRLGDRGAPVEAASGRSLSEAIAARARPNEDAVLARLRLGAAETIDAGTRIREVRGERLLERGGSPAERYWTLSPYVGCLIGCRFCYAPSRLDPIRRLEGRAAAPWGSWVDVRVDAPEVLARELVSLPARPIKLCPIVSDPYHAIEKRYRVTRRCLDVLAAAEPRGVLVLTRSASIVEDAERIAAIPLSWAGVSLPTIDDEVRAHFEPRAATIEERLAALRAVRKAGARTFAIVQPLLPGDVTELADALADTVESVRIDVLHGTFGAAADFADPRFAEANDARWQEARADELAVALRARGVAIWPGELPLELAR